MNILLNFPRHVEVDHILDIRDVKPTRQHRGCCQYGGLASTEVCQGLTDKDPFIFEKLERQSGDQFILCFHHYLLPLSLTPIPVDGSSSITFSPQLFTQLLSFVLRPV